MPAIVRIDDRLTLADLVALDRDKRPLLVAAADPEIPEPWVHASYLEVFQAIRRDIPFAILADPETLTIYRKNRTKSLEPLVTVPTPDILNHYDPSFLRYKWISQDYMIGMIDAWLRDFILIRLIPATPPALDLMASLGLADRLKDGWTKRRVRLACLPLRGDEFLDELRNGTEPGRGPDPQKSGPISPFDHA